jgi:hypothetical protein
MKKNVLFNVLVVLLSVLVLQSCSSIVPLENSFNGSINMEPNKRSPSGEFRGNNSSGIYSFEWNNTRNHANADIDITVTKGTVQLIINDPKGVEVFNTELTTGSIDSFSGITNSGAPGEWLIKLVFNEFNGEGSFSVERGKD